MALTTTDARSDPVLSFSLIALPAVTVLVIGLIGISPDLTGDVAFYHELSGQVVRGAVPYVDVELEYPILGLVPMLIPRLFFPNADPDLSAYQVAFVVGSALLTGLMAMVVGRFAMRNPDLLPRALAIFAIGVALTAHMVAWRYDVFPALLMALGLAFLASGRPVMAGSLVGLGAAAKLFPAVLIPIGLVWLVASRRQRDAVNFAAAATFAGLAPFLPILLIDPRAAWSFLAFQRARGFQIESVPAGLLELGSRLGWTPVGIEFAFKTYQITTPLTPALLGPQIAVTVLTQLALATALWLHIRRGSHGHRPIACLASYALAAVLAFMVTNKVLSPQHLVWLVPLVPLVGGVLVPVLIGAAALLGIVIFPAMYPSLIGLDLGAVLVLNVRNGALVAALIAVVVMHAPSLVRRSAPMQSTT